MDFSNYSAKDFVLNESFQKWILDPDEETRASWNDWMIKNPHKAEMVEEAKTIVQNIRNVLDKNAVCDADDVWARISRDINTSK
jgi:transmembrane sensor